MSGPSALVARRRLSNPVVTVCIVALSLAWSIPTMGLLITSLRPRNLAQSSGWWTILTDPRFTLDNYRAVLTPGSMTPDGALPYVLNSVVITVPAVVLPLALGCMAAYALAWIPFRGSTAVLLVVVGLQVVPVQMALLPLARLFGEGWSIGAVPILPSMDLGGSYLPLWVAHTVFALPLAIYLLHGFVSALPRDVLQAARIDGAGHLRIFISIVIPMCVPAMGAFAVLQFIWVWNDLLVALSFAGTSSRVVPITAYLASVKATSAGDLGRMAALGCIAILVPVLVFAIWQRTFVRGLVAGSVKG